MLIDNPHPELLVIGRKTATDFIAMQLSERGQKFDRGPFQNYQGEHGEVMLNGYDILPMIDAVTTEIILRMQEVPAAKPARRWPTFDDILLILWLVGTSVMLYLPWRRPC